MRRFEELKSYATVGLLYPRESETREVRSLDGIWQMLKGEPHGPFLGVFEEWYRQSLRQTKLKLISMPVPASYNDITTDKELRDHVGTVWYERNFFVPTTWQKDRHIWLRFGSVNYVGLVWVNGEQVVFHEFGQLPFEADVTRHLKFGKENRLTVMCDNRLSKTTIPPGQVITEEITVSGKVLTQKSRLDFFNYAGIQRSVHLYTTPLNHIHDIGITTSLNDNATKGRIEFCALINDKENEPIPESLIDVKLFDRDDNEVKITKSLNANCSQNFVGMVVIVDNVNPWWPYLMHPEPAYLYKMKVELYDRKKKLLDAYRLPVGIRQIDWNSTSLMINGKPIYFRGFSKHEESEIRGKGLDYPLMTREFNLLKWIGANAYRTSHYPHSEESMQFADEQGIMIIDECPAADMYSFDSDKVLGNHLYAWKQLTHRDRNHPSVIAWSIANEGTSYVKATNCDPDQPRECQLAQYLDIIGLNRNAGKSSKIVEKWHKVFNKPVLTLEYGVDSLEGLYMLPWSIGSEEYHGEIFIQHFKAFDQLRQKGWFIGEFVDSFTDLKKDRAFNKKGVFTSNRQPKMVAHLLRQRYFALGKELDNSTIPKDLYPYVTATFGKHDASEL
ncbi:uncharacterized protein Dwil_GK17843 [Drosophila willistoni]|uniref:Beta-glucuronidase n=1 Tax=Drosophila willistoni TaxID=7260 RepID=B4N5Y1_DROWI|nr:uncharacterized protein Dwil_GK17843 [Drosophila willistoni]